MSFSEDLWAANATLMHDIETMPFNRDLASGALDRATFQGYIVQDAHYLEGFARALALAASRAPDGLAVAQLAGSAQGALVVERQLHEEYMRIYGIAPEVFAATPPSRACDHYTSFLIKTAAVDAFPVAVAALLPCFWVYHEIGQMVHKQAAADHPYQAWIDTYVSDEFAQAVEAMRALTDRLAQTSNETVRARMHRAFYLATWQEWMFWHSAYHRETWPSPS